MSSLACVAFKKDKGINFVRFLGPVRLGLMHYSCKNAMLLPILECQPLSCTVCWSRKIDSILLLLFTNAFHEQGCQIFEPVSAQKWPGLRREVNFCGGGVESSKFPAD